MKLRTKNTPLTLAIIACAVVGVALFMRANAQESALLYIGDCVDIVAQREGASSLTPEEKWNHFSQYCAERYADR